MDEIDTLTEDTFYLCYFNEILRHFCVLFPRFLLNLFCIFSLGRGVIRLQVGEGANLIWEPK